MLNESAVTCITAISENDSSCWSGGDKMVDMRENNTAYMGRLSLFLFCHVCVILKQTFCAAPSFI